MRRMPGDMSREGLPATTALQTSFVMWQLYAGAGVASCACLRTIAIAISSDCS